jgi:Uma2 family endonuclease
MGMFEGLGTMLIEGVILESGKISPSLAICLEVANESLRSTFQSGYWIRQRLPLVLGPSTDPGPDFAVVRGNPRGFRQHPTSAELVVEVADSSLNFDTNEKRILYAKAGIRDYWVVDINDRKLLVFRDPQNGDYATRQTLGVNDAISPLAAPTASIRVADLLA